MGCGGHVFLHHGAAQAAYLEKLEKSAKTYTVYGVQYIIHIHQTKDYNS
jgi:hypothetical protein